MPQAGRKLKPSDYWIGLPQRWLVLAVVVVLGTECLAPSVTTKAIPRLAALRRGSRRHDEAGEEFG
jgi:hypothetical protein